MQGFVGAVVPVRIIGAVSLMSCMSYFMAMCTLSPLGREGKMAVSCIAAAPVSVALNLLLDGPFGAVGAAVALFATEATILCIELWCARDVLSSFVRARDLARMGVSNAAAAAVSAGCAWLLATVLSAGPGAIAIAGLLVYSAVDIAVAVALRDNTALMLLGKVGSLAARVIAEYGQCRPGGCRWRLKQYGNHVQSCFKIVACAGRKHSDLFAGHKVSDGGL